MSQNPFHIAETHPVAIGDGLVLFERSSQLPAPEQQPRQQTLCIRHAVMTLWQRWLVQGRTSGAAMRTCLSERGQTWRTTRRGALAPRRPVQGAGLGLVMCATGTSARSSSFESSSLCVVSVHLGGAACAEARASHWRSGAAHDHIASVFFSDRTRLGEKQVTR